MHRGYFRHYRKVADWALRDKPYAYSVWMYLLEMASGTDRKTYFHGEEVILEPGQLVTGRKKIAAATGVSESSVERWLDKLEKWEQIGQRKNASSRLITIRNWQEYQSTGQETDKKRTTTGQPADNDRTLIDKVKEGKRKKSNTTPHPCRGASSDPTDTTENLQVLKAICERVQQETGFNAFSFVVKKNSEKRGKGPWPAQCFVEVFEKFLEGKDIQKPWPYLEQIWKVHAPNVLERMSAQQSESLKDVDWGGMFKGVAG